VRQRRSSLRKTANVNMDNGQRAKSKSALWRRQIGKLFSFSFLHSENNGMAISGGNKRAWGDNAAGASGVESADGQRIMKNNKEAAGNGDGRHRHGYRLQHQAKTAYQKRAGVTASSASNKWAICMKEKACALHHEKVKRYQGTKRKKENAASKRKPK
jgi:hypothetical protein